MTDEESGKAFEAEFSHHVGFFDRDARDHDYLFSEVKFAWHGWQAAIRWMQSQQEWRPMDSALRDGTFLILGGGYWSDDLVRKQRTPHIARWHSGVWLITCAEAGYANCLYEDPTGWLPLPPPPKEGKE